ncbi:MAG TPA: hypothetical protein VF016_06840 [Nitrososphaera sp.]|nr:hypothetical protein [uncultured Nitrososphaera sp.]
MKSLPVVVATLFATLLAFSVVPAAFANDMNAVLVPQVDKGETHFIAVKNITFRYPADSAIAQELNGKQDRIQFTVSGNSSSTDNGVASAITAFNRALLQAQSPAMVTNMTITYTGTIRGFPDNALMTVKVEAVPNIEKFVISGGNSGGNQSTATSSAVDLEWRGLSVTDPIVLTAPDVGQIEITKPINLVDKLHKDLAKQIFESQASSMFTPSIINFDKFKQPMNTWHVLFDPSGRLVETSSFFAAENTAKVVSTYSLGESSFREGTFQPEESDATASIGGAQVQFHSQVPAPSGQIQIAGYAKLDQATGGNVALVTTDAPEGVTQSSGNFPIQVLLVLGGMMGAIAVFILFKARK